MHVIGDIFIQRLPMFFILVILTLLTVLKIIFLNVLHLRFNYDDGDGVFTALHGMHRGLAMRIPSVCPSVRPSVKRVNCDKTEERYV